MFSPLWNCQIHRNLPAEEIFFSFCSATSEIIQAYRGIVKSNMHQATGCFSGKSSMLLRLLRTALASGIVSCGAEKEARVLRRSALAFLFVKRIAVGTKYGSVQKLILSY